MAARLGYALFWLGCVAAIAVWGVGAFLAVHETTDSLSIAGLMTAVGMVPFAVGVAARYVLSGN